MEPRPVTRYRTPAYPTKLEVRASPALLQSAAMPAWMRATGAGGALAAFLAFNAGCERKDAPAAEGVKAAAAIVAPIFEHGEGRGATGCVVVTPPVFLSEEEALQIIREELRLAGLELESRDVVLDGVTLPPKPASSWDAGVPGGKAPPVDAGDARGRVAIEFVSDADYFAWGGVPSGVSAQSWDFKSVAKDVAAAVGAKGRGVYFGVFYDPGDARDDAIYGDARGGREYRDSRTSRELQSRRMLRLQVKDFADWLKGQGVL